MYAVSATIQLMFGQEYGRADLLLLSTQIRRLLASESTSEPLSMPISKSLIQPSILYSAENFQYAGCGALFAGCGALIAGCGVLIAVCGALIAGR